MTEASPEARPAPGQDGAHITYCRLCEAQCGLIATVADGRVVKIGPDRDHPVSHGHLCVKGPANLNLLYDPDRLLGPLKRVGAAGEFEPVTWEAAFADIGARLTDIKARHGDDSLGIYLGNPVGYGSMHVGYSVGSFQALGGRKLFTAVHADGGAKYLACQAMYGDPFLVTFPDLDDCDFLLMLGANPMVSHMSLMCEPRILAKLEAIERRGAVVIVDPRRTESARRFEHLPIKPDGDVWLLAGLLRVLIDDGLVDTAALDSRIVGWDMLAGALAAIDPAAAAARCGVDFEQMRALARRFAAARTAACYGRVGTNRGRFSTLANVFIEALNIVTGRFAMPGGWVFGRNPYGGEASEAPEHVFGAQRSRIGDLPMMAGLTPGGTLAAEIDTPGPGQMKALIVDCGNPVLSYPGGDRTAAALDQLDLMISIDLYMTETSRHASYILPAPTAFERADCNDLWPHFASTPWVQYSPAVVPPIGDVRHESDIYAGILAAMGIDNPIAPLVQPGDTRPPYLSAIDTMLRQGPFGDKLGAKPDGLSVARLEREFPHGLRHIDRVVAADTWQLVTHKDGRVRLWDDMIAAEMARLMREPAVDDVQGLRLFGRRKLRSLNSWMHNSPLTVRSDVPTLMMHPDDAHARHLKDGATAKVSTEKGMIEVVVEITEDVVAGSVCYPHGWGHNGGWTFANGLPGANVNLIASDDPADWEQVSGMIRVDGFPVEVTRA